MNGNEYAIRNASRNWVEKKNENQNQRKLICSFWRKDSVVYDPVYVIALKMNDFWVCHIYSSVSIYIHIDSNQFGITLLSVACNKLEIQYPLKQHFVLSY